MLLRYCAVRFATRILTWRLPHAGGVTSLVTDTHISETVAVEPWVWPTIVTCAIDCGHVRQCCQRCACGASRELTHEECDSVYFEENCEFLRVLA